MAPLYQLDLLRVLALPYPLLLVFLHNAHPRSQEDPELCKLSPQRWNCSKMNKGLQMLTLVKSFCLFFFLTAKPE